MLSREIGRERFQRILHNLTRRYAFREITWDELLRAIEVGAGRNLRWFYEQWFERTGAPDFQLTWRREGRRLRGVITQASPFYRADCVVAAFKSSETISFDILEAELIP
jgi:aminopeptidase N